MYCVDFPRPALYIGLENVYIPYSRFDTDVYIMHTCSSALVFIRGVLHLQNCVGDLDEHVGVCTCMFCSLPPSLLPSVCVYISFPIFFCIPLSLVSSDHVVPHRSDDVMPCPQVITSYPAGSVTSLLYILCTLCCYSRVHGLFVDHKLVFRLFVLR